MIVLNSYSALKTNAKIHVHPLAVTTQSVLCRIVKHFVLAKQVLLGVHLRRAYLSIFANRILAIRQRSVMLKVDGLCVHVLEIKSEIHTLRIATILECVLTEMGIAYLLTNVVLMKLVLLVA
jgi:hypothetical protein